MKSSRPLAIVFGAHTQTVRVVSQLAKNLSRGSDRPGVARREHRFGEPIMRRIFAVVTAEGHPLVVDQDELGMLTAAMFVDVDTCVKECRVG